MISVNAEANITIAPNSSVVILYGYYVDLEKQELTQTYRRLLNSLLPPLLADLHTVFGADVDYLYDGALTWQIAMQGLDKSDPASIRAVFKKRNYTHLIVANIPKLDSEGGLLALELATLSADGAPLARSPPTPGIPLSRSMSPTDLDIVRQTIMSYFTSAFQVENDTKRVYVERIYPRAESPS